MQKHYDDGITEISMDLPQKGDDQEIDLSAIILNTLDMLEIPKKGSNDMLEVFGRWLVGMHWKENGDEEELSPLWLAATQRPELIRDLLISESLFEFVKSAQELTQWAYPRGISIRVGGLSWWRRFQLYSYNLVVGI